MTGCTHAGIMPRSSPHTIMSLASISTGSVRSALVRHRSSCEEHQQHACSGRSSAGYHSWQCHCEKLLPVAAQTAISSDSTLTQAGDNTWRL